MIFIHDITLPPPTNGDEHQEKFVNAFNTVSELFQKSKDPNLSQEEQNKYFEAFWQAKYCLEQGIGF